MSRFFPSTHVKFHLLPPAYVVRREGNVLTRVCPSMILSVHRGGGSVLSPARGEGVRSSRRGGGQIQPGGGIRSSRWGGVRSSRGGWVRSSLGGSGPDRGGQVQLGGSGPAGEGHVQPGGGSGPAARGGQPRWTTE